MNIQPINFSAKQRFDYHKPHFNPFSQSTEISHNNPFRMINQAKQAQAIVPTLREASKFALEKSRGILYDSKQIQNTSEKLMSEIIDTSAYLKYCSDKRRKINTTHSYVSSVKLNDEIYDVKITQNKISAVQRINTEPYFITTNKNATPIDTIGKKVFEFDPKTTKLTYFADGIKRQGCVGVTNAQYFFKDNKLSKCDLGVSDGTIALVDESFEFEDDILKSFSSKIVEESGKTTTQRFFEYHPTGTLSSFTRNLSIDNYGIIKKDLSYDFYQDGSLKEFKKDFKKEAFDWEANLFCDFTDDDNFYVCSNYSTKKSPEYSSIIFYNDGKIEGGLI